MAIGKPVKEQQQRRCAPINQLKQNQWSCHKLDIIKAAISDTMTDKDILLKILETERLNLRTFSLNDAAFLLEQMNEPAFLLYVGDRGLRTLDDAREFIKKRLIAHYDKNGFSFYVAERKEDDEIIGMCGLVDRDGLDGVDIGFAILPAHWKNGYAYEASQAVMLHARDDIGLKRVLAITDPRNKPSNALLKKLGMTHVSMVTLPGDTKEDNLYAIDF